MELFWALFSSVLVLLFAFAVWCYLGLPEFNPKQPEGPCPKFDALCQRLRLLERRVESLDQDRLESAQLRAKLAGLYACDQTNEEPNG